MPSTTLDTTPAAVVTSTSYTYLPAAIDAVALQANSNVNWPLVPPLVITNVDVTADDVWCYLFWESLLLPFRSCLEFLCNPALDGL